MSGFLGMNIHKRTIRANVNPLDKSTVVSIFPRQIIEFKPTIQPGRFQLEAGTYHNPSILVVGSSSWWRDIDEDQPLLEIPVSSVQVADSIVRDYCNGLLACDMNESTPGLFFIPGEQTLEQIKRDHKDKLDLYARKQKNWYESLIRLADALWARSNGNPLSISDHMRLAAQELQLKEKTWMGDFNTLQLTNCPACGTLRNNNFPVCSNCKTVLDKAKFKELGLVQA
jgi:hypothetical protein